MTQIQIGSLTLDQPYYVDGNGFQWTLSTTTGIRDSPPFRTNYTPRPLAWGQYDGPVFPDKRVITINASATTTTEVARLTAIRQCVSTLADGSIGNMVITDELGTVFAPVRISGQTTTKMVGQSGFDFSMQFTAADPRLLGDTVSDSTLMAQSSGLGIPWRGVDGTKGVRWRGAGGTAGTPWRTGGAADSGVLSLSNPGTAPADITFTFRGPAVNPAVFTSTNRIAYNGTLGVGDVLTINTGSGAVLLNGVNRRPFLSRAEWFGVPAFGSLDIIFTADVQNPDASCTAEFNISYI